MTKYCPICDAEREVQLEQQQETYPVKGEDTTIMATVCKCTVCGEEIMSIEFDDDNLRKAYLQYRLRHRLLTPDQIKKIREQYGVSQITFARILGVGDKTIARYENGSLQDEAINNLIMLAENPQNFLELLEKNAEKISQEEANRIKQSITETISYPVWTPAPKCYVFPSIYQDVCQAC